MDVRVLFVEDNDRLRGMLLEAVENYHSAGVASAEEAVTLLGVEPIDILVTDINLPGMSGLDLLQQAQRLRPDIIMIAITAFGTIDVAVEAMKRGATDFLTKPFALSDLSGIIRVAAERIAGRAPGETTASPGVAAAASGGGRGGESPIVATAPGMRKLLDQVTAIAPFNTTVLITGETGTGKEMVARSIHQQSPRRARPMISLNCAAVPEQLLEDELFGHVKGAFTGAAAAREGRFEQADGGTLFLDEIGDMSLPLQSKLLRVLQEREFEKLGSSRTVKVDVRIIAATSANLDRRIDEGSFRPDLYYRLNVVNLKLPPLRERADDVRPLAEHLLSRFCASAGLPAKKVSEDVWPALYSYRWPGNVRQLQNAMERAAALSGASTQIALGDLPEEVRGGAVSGITPTLLREPEPLQFIPPPSIAATSSQPIPDEGLSFDAVVTRVERDLLLQSLNKAGGNKMRAAKLLNMKRTTFVEKLKRLQINTDEGDEWKDEG